MNTKHAGIIHAEKLREKITQIKLLKTGDKLTYDGTIYGEVTDVGYLGVRVGWADGLCTVLLFREMDDGITEVLERLEKIEITPDATR